MATENGHREAMELLLKHGATLEEEDQNPILHAAARAGNDDLVRYLVEEKKVRLDTTDALKYAPLGAAIKSNQLSTVKILLDYGAPLESCLWTVKSVHSFTFM